MKNLSNQNQSESMTHTDMIQWLKQKILSLENELMMQQEKEYEGWVSLEMAAKSLGKSTCAVRQRLKHPQKAMPQGKVWKQQAKGHAISIHLANFRKFM